MSSLVDEDYDAEQNLSCKESSKGRSASTMFLYLRELFFLFALVFTSYTALFNSLPKIGKAPTPVPFFPRNSVVVDYYKGTVNAAFQRVSEVDLAVVMYYAPWDADSQVTRAEFESAGQFFKDEAFFTAISCWSPNSECKQHVPRIRHFPVIVAYLQHSKGIHYQGPLKSVYIINFIKTVMRPVRRILNPSDIFHLTSQFSVLVVGFFLFSGNLGAPGYYTFYSTALRMLENDPFCEVGFAVTTDQETASVLEFDMVPSIRLYLWNETYDYPLDADYTEESLVKWILKKMNKVVQWVSPPKLKSQTLSPHISNGPALILFTPRNPLVEINPMFSMLKEIAYRYHNCNNNSWVEYLSAFIDNHTNNLKLMEGDVDEYCFKLKKINDLYKVLFDMMSVTVPTISNTTEVLEDDMCDAGSVHSQYLGPEPEVCYKGSKSSSILLDNIRHDTEYNGILSLLKDEKAPRQLLKKWDEFECKNFEFLTEYYHLPFPRAPDNSQLTEAINGLACVNNRTLKIIAMDSLSHYQFAEGLGINILDMKDKTAAVIVDKKGDSQFVMKEEVSKDNLISFIMNHTLDKLNRSQRSSHDSKARTVTRHRYPVRASENCTHTDTESCVPELNSKSFLDFVMNPEKTVIVFYHTPYCALCRSISHLFLLLSRYFRHFPGLKFARIDGDNNDLPWEYTMDLYPAILFFPTVKKSESRVYSSNLPFTIKNLIHFVLANLEPEAKVPAMLSLCITFEKLQSESEARKCKSKIQKESYDYLSATLKDMRKVMNRWRNTPPTSRFVWEIRRRKELLTRKLEYFKSSHFLLGSVDKIERNSNVVVKGIGINI
ncbi:hypothetical protein RUM44_010726 [Polyplax serrata]|uniref:Thioredoxin domain-containing protein n=1 Tax=Polyplax serrata TaxID=468196 RepID=A0ABR1AN12_POLSC